MSRFFLFSLYTRFFWTVTTAVLWRCSLWSWNSPFWPFIKSSLLIYVWSGGVLTRRDTPRFRTHHEFLSLRIFAAVLRRSPPRCHLPPVRPGSELYAGRLPAFKRRALRRPQEEGETISRPENPFNRNIIHYLIIEFLPSLLPILEFLFFIFHPTLQSKFHFTFFPYNFILWSC